MRSGPARRSRQAPERGRSLGISLGLPGKIRHMDSTNYNNGTDNGNDDDSNKHDNKSG